MKKVLLVLFVMLFAATSFAAELKLSGGMHVRGQWFQGLDSEGLTGTDLHEDYDVMYYDQDLTIDATIVADENTMVGLRLAVEDNPWVTNAYNGGAGSDNHMQIERAYLMHKFGNGLALTAGRITGGGWAYDFGNNVEGLHRVKLTKKMSDTLMVGGFVQKNVEEYTNTNTLLVGTDSVEANDSDTYAGFANINMNGHKIMPLVAYTTDGISDPAPGDSTSTVTTLDVAYGGSFGGTKVMAELIYKTGTNDSTDVDTATMGLYVGAEMDMSGTTVGVDFAYASGDDDAADGENTRFSMNDNFEFGIIGNWYLDGLPGLTMISPYASYGMDAWTFDGRFIYAMTSVAEDTMYYDGTNEVTGFMEVDGSASYAFSDAFSYTAGLAWMSIQGDTEFYGANAPDAVTRLYHYVAVSF